MATGLIVVVGFLIVDTLQLHTVFFQTKENHHISTTQIADSTLLFNQNPGFSVHFGQKKQPNKQWVRFEAQASDINPFEQTESSKTEVSSGILSNIVDSFAPKETLGIEMSLLDFDLNHSQTTVEIIEANSQVDDANNLRPVVINSNVFNGVDLEYQVLEGLGLKEDIVIHDLSKYAQNCDDLFSCNQALNEFIFDVQLDEGLTINRSQTVFKGNNVEIFYFTDNNNRYVAHFLPSWAIDANGQITYDVKLELVENAEQLLIKVVVSQEWLFSDQRVFPVRIDPTIVHDSKADFDNELLGIPENTEKSEGFLSNTRSSTIECTGGTITTHGDYTIHTFTSGGTLSCNGDINVEYLVVGGGGGGGNTRAGGGGAGGLLTNVGSAPLLIQEGDYSITIGQGGSGSTSSSSNGGNGQNSSIGSLVVASGGGGGGSSGSTGGNSGGSGGGGAGGIFSGGSGGGGTAGQGNNGGNGSSGWFSRAGGGGGGAGSAGTNASGSSGGSGGSGLASSISGSSVTYSAGGNGGSSSGSAGAGASANSGSGGAGGSGTNNGGGGGSGIVIIRYEIISVPPAPTAPTNCLLKRNINANQILISWENYFPDTDSFTIQRSVNGGAFVDLITDLSPAVREYSDSSTSLDNSYQYRIALVSGLEISDWCLTATLNNYVGLLNFEGIDLEGLNFD